MTKIIIDTHHIEIPENIGDWLDENCSTWSDDPTPGDESSTWVLPKGLTIPEEIQEWLDKNSWTRDSSGKLLRFSDKH